MATHASALVNSTTHKGWNWDWQNPLDIPRDRSSGGMNILLTDTREHSRVLVMHKTHVEFEVKTVKSLGAEAIG